MVLQCLRRQGNDAQHSVWVQSAGAEMREALRATCWSAVSY